MYLPLGPIAALSHVLRVEGTGMEGVPGLGVPGCVARGRARHMFRASGGPEHISLFWPWGATNPFANRPGLRLAQPRNIPTYQILPYNWHTYRLPNSKPIDLSPLLASASHSHRGDPGAHQRRAVRLYLLSQEHWHTSVLTYVPTYR